MSGRGVNAATGMEISWKDGMFCPYWTISQMLQWKKNYTGRTGQSWLTLDNFNTCDVQQFVEYQGSSNVAKGLDAYSEDSFIFPTLDNFNTCDVQQFVDYAGAYQGASIAQRKWKNIRGTGCSSLYWTISTMYWEANCGISSTKVFSSYELEQVNKLN